MNRDDVLRRLRDADPASHERVDGAAREPLAQRALEEIISQPLHGRSGGRNPRLAPIGISVAVLISVVVIGMLATQRPAEVRLGSAQVALTRAAEVAAGATVPQLAPGQYLYARTAATELFTFGSGDERWTAFVPVQQEFWIAPDGSGRIREVPGRPTFSGQRDRALWRASGKPRVQGRPSDRVVGPGALAPDLGAEASTDAQSLALVLLRTDLASDLPEDQRLFVVSSDLLSSPLVTPELRSSLYHLVAGLDKVELLGHVKDPMGRTGIGVAIPSGSTGVESRRVLIFDEATSAVLAEEVILLEPVEWIDARPPIVAESRVFSPAAIVASDHDRVAG